MKRILCKQSISSGLGRCVELVSTCIIRNDSYDLRSYIKQSLS